MSSPDLDRDLVQDLVEGRAPATILERELATTARACRRVRVAGPTREAAERLHDRFARLVDGTEGTTPWARFRDGFLRHPALQRAAAGIVLFATVTTGGSVATGHNPVNVAAATLRFATDAVASLDPRNVAVEPSAEPGPDVSTPPNPAAAPAGEPAAEPGASPTTPPATAPGEHLYRVAEAGTVTLEVDGDQLRILDASPEPGWTVAYDHEPDGSVEVRFRSREAEVKFEAELEGGAITTSTDREGRGHDDG